MKLSLLSLGFLTLFLTHYQTVHSVVIKVENLPERCDFRKCTEPDPTKLNVHLVPHTHDDVGWLKTVDQYYYGSNASLANAGVQYILDSVVAELIQNKERRFIYVETAFFWMWWLEQNEEQRAVVHELVRTGQLEFINGGWSMNDEAATHYNSIIDQMTWGLRRLNDTFGRCGVPKIAWQIDPFGHSREQANLFAQMNFDALFFAREDYQDKDKRHDSKTLEHVWQGSDDLGRAGDLFTGMMHMGYGPPDQFNWDLISMKTPDEPVVDNLESDEYNVPEMVEKLVSLATDYAKGYATNNVLFPMGTDFQYQDAHTHYKNMDKLIKHVNARSKEVKIFYSTPSCYAKALHDTERTWTGKVDDYFPYASDPHAYWTGYFSSRPAVKRFERIGNNVLQVCKQVDALAENRGKYEREVTRLREYMGVMQHHDAVTGTEKQHVAFNYAKHLEKTLLGCIDVVLKSYRDRLLPKQASTLERPTFKQEFCQHLNVSACAITEGGHDFIANIYNPLGHAVRGKLIRLPVDHAKYYTVTGPKGEDVQASLVKIPEYVQKIPGRVSKAEYELVFRADLPALGLVTYFVQATKTRSSKSAPDAKETKITRETALFAKNFNVYFDASGGLDHLELRDGRKVALNSDFRYYQGHDGDNKKFETRASGAYIFRPSDDQKTFVAGRIVEAELFEQDPEDKSGVQEVHQRFDTFVNQVIRVDPTQDIVEFEWVIGPIPVEDGIGKEIVTRFSTDLKNNRTFYTDANGRQMLKRVWNYRPTWKLQVEEPISGNYYPVNSRIFLRDEKADLQFTVLNDRSQGGTSPLDGALELMVHRRLLVDDAFGVGEALDEPGVDGHGLVIRGKHVLVLESISKSAAKHREIAQQLFMEPLITFASGISEQDYRQHYHTELSALTEELPRNVHLLTLEEWHSNRLLLRLEHFYQKGEDSELSKPVTVNLRHMFKHFEVEHAEELTLSANANIEAAKHRMQFKYTPAGGPVVDEEEDGVLDQEKLEVKLKPMQIRTFLIRPRWGKVD